MGKAILVGLAIGMILIALFLYYAMNRIPTIS